MAVQENPFVYGRPISREEDLADREEEKRALRRDVLSGQPVMMHAPRRYGKTSLARVVAERLQEDGTPYVYADLWGVRSIADVVGPRRGLLEILRFSTGPALHRRTSAGHRFRGEPGRRP
jgi:hypothetical protein